jgi:hypothetical protein
MRLRLPLAHPALWWMFVLALWGSAAHAAEFVYTVQPGDHLWNIGQRYLRSPALALPLRELNGIVDDRRIAPGTRVRIPERWLRLQTTGVRLLAFSGDVSVRADGASARVPVLGETLQPPLRLLTGKGASASLQFADGSRVLVLQDSELGLRQAATRLVDRAGMVVMDLLRGGMENEVTPRAPQGGRYEIHTPAAIGAVRGTQFRLHAWQEGDARRARSEVLEGAVQFGNAAGTVLARAAQGSVASQGAVPTPPAALLPPPDLSPLPERAERLPLALPFTPLPGAARYRSQLAPDADFHVTLSDQTSEGPRVTAAALPDGPYVLRVRGIDAQGLEGLAAQRPLELRTQPVPPLQIEPAPGAITSQARPTFRWTQVDRASGYRLRLMSESPQSATGAASAESAGNAARAGGAAGEPLADRQVDATGQAVPQQDLPPGAYAWRVATIDANGRQGPFSDAQAFRIVLPGPQAQAVAGPPGGLTLRWSAMPGAAGYRAQLAGPAGFDPPLRAASTTAPEWTLQDLPPGAYQVRVQALEADGTALPFGEPQRFQVTEPDPPSGWLRLLLLVPLLLL